MMRTNWLIPILILMLVVPALAAPTAPTVSLISGGNATFSSTGAAGTCWFRWGMSAAYPEWKTPNQTTSGTCTQRIYGGPYIPHTNYNAVACDVTGCSAAQAFTSGTNSPIVIPTLNAVYQNITDNNFDFMVIIANVQVPLLWWNSPTSAAFGLALLAGLSLVFYFIGLWLSQRQVALPVLMFMIILAFVLTPQTGIQTGLPAEFAQVAQVVCYVAITGMLVSLIKKG
jgi:hypothetical protein